MIFDSRLDNDLGPKGLIIQLISPLITISQSTQLQFSYYMPHNQSDGGSLFQLFQFSKLRTPVLLPFESSKSAYSHWQRAITCLPSGSYYLVFEGKMGNPLISDIAIDSIRVLTNKQCLSDSKPMTNRKNRLRAVGNSPLCSCVKLLCIIELVTRVEMKTICVQV